MPRLVSRQSRLDLDCVIALLPKQPLLYLHSFSFLLFGKKAKDKQTKGKQINHFEQVSAVFCQKSECKQIRRKASFFLSHSNRFVLIR